MLINIPFVWDTNQYWNLQHLPSLQNYAWNFIKKWRPINQKLNSHEMREVSNSLSICFPSETATVPHNSVQYLIERYNKVSFFNFRIVTVMTIISLPNTECVLTNSRNNATECILHHKEAIFLPYAYYLKFIFFILQWKISTTARTQHFFQMKLQKLCALQWQ